MIGSKQRASDRMKGKRVNKRAKEMRTKKRGNQAWTVLAMRRRAQAMAFTPSLPLTIWLILFFITRRRLGFELLE